MGSPARIEAIPDGFVVFCRLCGKRDKRTFTATRCDDPHKAAIEYLNEHKNSATHRAAIAASRAAEVPSENAEELLLRRIFGGPPPSEAQLRRRAAKDAAAIARNEKKPPPQPA